MIFVPMIGVLGFAAWHPFVKNRYAGGTSYGFGTENAPHYWLDL